MQPAEKLQNWLLFKSMHDIRKFPCLCSAYTTNIDHKKVKNTFCLITSRKHYGKFIKDSNSCYWYPRSLNLRRLSTKVFLGRIKGEKNTKSAVIPCYWYRETEVAEFMQHQFTLEACGRILYPFPESETRVSTTRLSFFSIDTFP